MKQRWHRNKRRIFAAFLCFCVLFTMPGIQSVFPVIAAGQEESIRTQNIITAFEPLSKENKVQTVFIGTDMDELDLPEELTVYLLWESSEQKVEDSERESTEQENTEKIVDIEENSDIETESEQDTQTEESKGLEETDEIAVMDSEDIADTKDEENSTGESAPAEEQEETVAINGIIWQSEPEYDGNTEGTYIFTAVLPDGYTLAEGVSLPKITVTVGNGVDAIIQALRDRIAALPYAEESLASEPDMEDDDAYAEWEEKLYEYAEEALAILEEYEALTEERQAQISEEELIKLTAWVEIAETLAESSQIMTTNDAEHKHCICSGNEAIGDHTNHTEIEYKMLTTNSSGQILIDGNVYDNNTLTTGNYYLPEPDNPEDKTEIEIGTITIDGNVTLCLNGGTLKHIGETGSVIVVSSGTFTLCDCKNDTGCIMEGKGNLYNGTLYGGGVFVNSGAIFNMYGGVITKNTAQNGGGVDVSHGTKVQDESCVFNMYGGKIVDNTAVAGGGGINLINVHANIVNGTIEGNSAWRGGGIYANGVYLTMSNVSVVNNIVTNSNKDTGINGAGIYFWSNTEFFIAGKINITQNWHRYDNRLENVYIRNNFFFHVTDKLDGSSIGVTAQTPPTSAKPAPVQVAGGKEYGITPADWSCFFSDKDDYEILRKETTDNSGKSLNELWLALPGSCDLGGLDLSASGATLSPSPFDPDTTRYTSEVANSVDQVGITATLADTASGADITIKINGGSETPMENGKLKTVNLAEGENTIVITVTVGEMSKAYIIKITREEAPAGFTVTLNGNGGSAGTDLTSYDYGTGATLPTDWTKTGYTFAGWYENVNCTGAKVENISATDTGDKEYWAKWTPNSYKVRLNGNGGSAGTALTTYTYGTKVTLPTDWTRTGYSFAGWYDNENCTGTKVENISATATGNKEYWASWTPISYTITYLLDGGTVTGNPASYTIEDSAITLNNPTREGYNFTGWGGTDLTGNNHMSVTIASGSTGNRTYTAYWEVKGYTVTLHGNGGSAGTDLTSYDYGTGAVLPTNWTKTGYVFDGWYDNEGCIGTAVTSISASDTGNKEYWAKWTDNIAPVIGTLSYDYQPKNFWQWLIGKKSLIITVPVTEEGSGADKITYTVTPDGGTAKVETATIQNGEAEITVSKNFKGTISIVCTDQAGNTSTSVTVGTNGIIIEDKAPNISFKAENAESLSSGEYKTVPDIVVTVADDKDNAISGGIASVSYQINGGSEKTVAYDYTTGIVESDSFTISADEITASGIPADGVVISVTATDNAGNSTTETYTVKVHIHSGTLVAEVKPTCTDAGNKQYYTCTCGKWFSDSGCTNEITDKGAVVLDALRHYFEGQPYQITTTQHWRKCSRCSVTEQKEDHSFGADDKCTVCEYSKVVDPGHTHSGTLVAATKPTCTLPGNIAYYSCSSCGKLFSDSGCTVEITEQDTKIEALKHDFSVTEYDQNEHWQQCSRCALEQSRAPHVYDNDTDTECNVCGYVRTLQGHTHSGTLVAAKPAACTEDGHSAYYICTCGKWFTDSACANEITDHASVVVEKLGHNFAGEYLFDANGHWRVCSRCNAAQTPESHVFDDDNDTTCNKCKYQRTIGTHTHSGTLAAATEPTCATAGNKAYYRCSCGKWFSDSSCTKEVTAQDVTIPAKGHTAVTDPAKAATCTETGLSEGSHCSVCGHVIKAQTVTAALGHDYSGNYHYDAGGHWKVCSRCGTVSAKQRHNYDNDRDTECNDCGWVRMISDSDNGQDEQPTPTPTPETPVPPTPQPAPTPPSSPTNPPEQSQPTETPEDKQEPESTGTPEPTEKPSETEQEQQPEGDGEQTVSAAMDNGKIVISGEPVATGNVEGMADTKTVLKLGDGAVIVTVVCAGQEYTAGVADTLAVANAVLTPEQIQLVNNGETIEIRIDVKDISAQVPEQDKETIENGIREYQKEVPGLTLGMYVDISMFIRIGEGDWNAITATRKPIEVIIGIPESLQAEGRTYYIIRAHDGVPAFMNDMDDEPGTITVSTDLFSSYAIAYVQADGTGHKCGLCHICPTFLGLCCFVWLAIIILIMVVVIIVLRKKKEEQET